jgi:hypothetical protein
MKFEASEEVLSASYGAVTLEMHKMSTIGFS